MPAFGQVQALPPIEVNVCFRALIPESGLADFGPYLPSPMVRPLDCPWRVSATVI